MIYSYLYSKYVVIRSYKTSVDLIARDLTVIDFSVEGRIKKESTKTVPYTEFLGGAEGGIKHRQRKSKGTAKREARKKARI